MTPGMQKKNTIEHSGTVKSVDNGIVIVNIESHPACSGCLASGICELSDNETREIKAVRSYDAMEGDRVLVVMRQSMGFRALFLGYILPFIIILFILVLMTSLSFSEPVSGLTAILALIFYYTVIYLKKEKIGRSFSFTIKKPIK